MPLYLLLLLYPYGFPSELQKCKVIWFTFPPCFHILAFVSIKHVVSTFSHAVVDRRVMWFGVSLIWSELVWGTLSEPVGCSASESSVSHSVSRLVNRRVCLYVSHRQSVGKSFGQFRGQPSISPPVVTQWLNQSIPLSFDHLTCLG
jgi:hypothetical protein